MKKPRQNKLQFFFTLVIMGILTLPIAAQSTAFTYQGKLADNGNPATGSYDMQFKLFDAVTVGTGAQQGSTVTVSNVSVTSGIFTVALDFGVCSSCFNGAARFLEIAVKPTSSGTFTTLGPRQQINSTPYAIKSLNAATAEGLSVACVNCVTSSQIQSVNGSSISGAIPVASVPAGSTNYIQNGTSQQATSNFNISGDGTAANINVNGSVTISGVMPPATAPAGQGRIYFDTATNKVKVSENGAAFVNLIGASGVSGSGTTNTIPLWSAGTTLGNSLITQSAGNIGIGISNPTIGQLHVLSSTVNVPAIYGESATSRAVWGKSVSSRGVYGESSSNEGVHGVSNTGSGVYGESAATNTVTFTGVFGVSTGSGGTGVSGLSTGSGGFGVYGESATGRAVYGKSVSSRGVYGESNSSEGVFGISNTATGVFGVSTNASGVGGYFQNNAGGTALKVDGSGTIIFSGTGNVGIGTTTPTLGRVHVVAPSSTTGIYGESAAANTITNSGVYGRSTGNGGVGVIGEANTGNSYGVYGTTTSANASSTGVYGSATSGFALFAEGSAGQSRDKGGFVKAMIMVNQDGTIARCYNGLANSSTGNCGFTVSHPSEGEYDINFGFKVDDRFLMTMPLNNLPTGCVGGAATLSSLTGNVATIATFCDFTFDKPFMIFVF
jgi:hypothetical protein